MCIMGGKTHGPAAAFDPQQRKYETLAQEGFSSQHPIFSTDHSKCTVTCHTGSGNTGRERAWFGQRHPYSSIYPAGRRPPAQAVPEHCLGRSQLPKKATLHGTSIRLLPESWPGEAIPALKSSALSQLPSFMRAWLLRGEKL